MLCVQGYFVDLRVLGLGCSMMFSVVFRMLSGVVLAKVFGLVDPMVIGLVDTRVHCLIC